MAITCVANTKAFYKDHSFVIMEEMEICEPVERPSTYPPHHRFNLAVSEQVKKLFVRDKRQIFVSMRAGNVTSNTFFPKFALCASEFATWQILNENPRRTMPQKSAE